MILKLVLFNQALVYVQSYAAGLDKKPANIKSREATKIKSDCNYLSDWQVLKKKNIRELYRESRGLHLDKEVLETN